LGRTVVGGIQKALSAAPEALGKYSGPLIRAYLDGGEEEFTRRIAELAEKDEEFADLAEKFGAQ
jgi:hypothetical protein